jgi:hypothetical protein
MKTIYLTPEEHRLLLDILQCCLSDLRMEIVGTDHWDFKRRLRERKATVLQLLEKLEEEQPKPVAV